MSQKLFAGAIGIDISMRYLRPVAATKSGPRSASH